MKFVTLAALFELEGDYETYKGAKRHDQILMILRFANRLARRIDDDRRAWVSISELLDPRIKLHTVAQAKQSLKKKNFSGEIRQEYRERHEWDPKIPDNPDALISKWRLFEEPQGSLEL